MSGSAPLYLSTITLRTDRRAPPNAYTAHGAIEGLFDGLPFPSGSRALWSMPRADILVVQGPAPVDASKFRPGTVAGASWRPVEIPAEGARIRVSLVANPARNPSGVVREDTGRRRATRTPLPAGQRNDWLLRHLGGAVALDPATIGGVDLGAASAVQRSTGFRITAARHLFHARGTVAGADALRRLILAGVGPSKAWGCGLLIVRPDPA